jgi:hypothetical protein
MKTDAKRPKYYSPSKDLTEFVAERLQSERISIERTRAGEELTDSETKVLRKLATRKTRILDKVFQQMADLTFFFESIAAYKELQDLFENDLSDLIGLKQETQTSNALSHNQRYPIFFQPDAFRRLVGAVLAVNNDADESFRLSLPYEMQELIHKKMDRVMPTGITFEIAQIMLSDMKRAMAWTKLYASGVKDDDNLGYHRALGYSFRAPIPHRSYVKELESRGRIL